MRGVAFGRNRIGPVIVTAALLALPTACEHRPDLEETGYTSFVFEIDNDGRSVDAELQGEMARLMKKRLDPDGKYGVDCRPVESGRVEVRVQTPPADVVRLRTAFEETLAKLTAATQPADASGAGRVADFSVGLFRVALDMQDTPEWEESREFWRKEAPELTGLIDEAIVRHKAWRAKGTYVDNPPDVIQLLRGMGVLEFRILVEPDPYNPVRYDPERARLQEQGPEPLEGDTTRWFPIAEPVSFLYLDSPRELRDFDCRENDKPFIVDQYDGKWYVLAERGREYGLLRPAGSEAAWRLHDVRETRDYSDRLAVMFALDPIAASVFSELTERNIDRQLCALVDDVAYSSANIESRISSEGIITGDFSMERIQFLLRTLRAQLPARLKIPPVSERVVEPKRSE